MEWLLWVVSGIIIATGIIVVIRTWNREEEILLQVSCTWNCSCSIGGCSADSIFCNGPVVLLWYVYWDCWRSLHDIWFGCPECMGKESLTREIPCPDSAE